MHELETLQNLIDYILLVDVFQDVGSYHSMQISIHEVEDKVDITVIFGANDVLKSDDIFMTRELLEEDNLSEGALGVSCILKGVKILLQSDDLFCLFVNGFPHDTISSLAYILSRHIKYFSFEK